MTTNHLHSGIDLSALDPAVRPQDDLYRHVNGRWIDSYEIPADRAMDGAFRALHDRSEEHVREIIEELGAQVAEGAAPVSEAAAPVTGTAAQVGALYASFMDTATVERLGVEPI